MTGLETCPKSARDVVLATNVHSACKCPYSVTSKCFLLRSTVGTPSAQIAGSLIARTKKNSAISATELETRNLACGHLLRGLSVHKRGELVQFRDVDAWVSC